MVFFFFFWLKNGLKNTSGLASDDLNKPATCRSLSILLSPAIMRGLFKLHIEVHKQVAGIILKLVIKINF